MRVAPAPLLVPLLLVAPVLSGGVAAAPAPDASSGPPPAGAALAAFVDNVAPGAGLGARLLRAGLLQDAPVEPPRLRPVAFPEAMDALYAAAGVAPPADLAPPPGPLADALAPVVAAHAAASAMVRDAFSALSAEERAYLLARVDALLLPGGAVAGAPDPRAEALAARVDVARMLVGAAVLAEAMGAFEPPEASLAASWVDPMGLVEVGTAGDDVYLVERALIVDLGGNDRYENHAASFAPGSGVPLPVGAVLDVGGDDAYLTNALHASSLDLTWGQGVGVGGVGLLVDLGGDDRYRAELVDLATPCAADHALPDVHRQVVLAQAVGVLGVGALLDARGNDTYEALSANALPLPCKWGKAYAFAQGVGLHRGVGALLDSGGDDAYLGRAEQRAKDDKLAHAHCQAAGAGGVAVLVDAMGNDTYACEAEASAVVDGSARYNGSFAYVFAQASNLATREGPFGGSLLGAACAPLLETCDALPGPGLGPCLLLAGGGVEGCARVGAAVLVDMLGTDSFLATPVATEPSACRHASWAVSSAQGSAAWSGLAALLDLDVEGADLFHANPFAKGDGCHDLFVGAFSYGQGYGGPVFWGLHDHPGVDVVDADGLARAAPFWAPAVGLLVSGGLPEAWGSCPAGTPGSALFVEPAALAQGLCAGTLQPSVSALAGAVEPVLPARGAPDTYLSTPTAVNTCDGPTVAESWAQGAGGNLADTQGPALGAPLGPAWLVLAAAPLSADMLLGTGVGVGIHADFIGDDRFNSTPSARTHHPSPTFVLSVAQGAGHRGVGILANAGGADEYAAYALGNWVHAPERTWGQAWAEGRFPVVDGEACILFPVAFCLPAAASAPAVGLLVEVGGFDAYTEAVESGPGLECQGNGVTFGAWPPVSPAELLGLRAWGNVPHLFPVACAPVAPWGPYPDSLAVGVDAHSEIAL